jgi:gamma-glutamyltranspeptidase/glutathione hydrolase
MIGTPEGKTQCVDFLPDFPEKASDPPVKPIRTEVIFKDAKQVFYLGYGSMATPGVLFGLLHIHKKHCTLELDKILAPAIDYARNGVVTNATQAYLFDILHAYCLYTKECRDVFAPEGELAVEGDVVKNEKTADFLTMLGKDEDSAIDFFHESIEQTLKGNKSILSIEDVERYRVKERDPISINYHDHEIYTSPPPSAGGLLISYALELLKKNDVRSLKHNSLEHSRLLIKTMEESNAVRTKKFFDGLFHTDNFWKQFLANPNIVGSTTHISVIDEEGNSIGISSSNGESAGVMIKNTGIMFNNFAAEPDLMQYKELYKPGERITSMMSPTFMKKDGEVEAVLGTGGSIRIRSAMQQVISNMIDFGMNPQQATDAARLHVEEDTVQIEPGFDKKVVDSLSKEKKTNLWSRKDYYFGGVHIATPDTGAGDHRRGGAVLKI